MEKSEACPKEELFTTVNDDSDEIVLEKFSIP
jgi:hypothetical protein